MVSEVINLAGLCGLFAVVALVSVDRERAQDLN